MANKKVYFCERYPDLEINDPAIQFQNGSYNAATPQEQAVIENNDWYNVHVFPAENQPTEGKVYNCKRYPSYSISSPFIKFKSGIYETDKVLEQTLIEMHPYYGKYITESVEGGWWRRHLTEIIIGVIVTVVGGLVVAFLVRYLL